MEHIRNSRSEEAKAGFRYKQVTLSNVLSRSTQFHIGL